MRFVPHILFVLTLLGASCSSYTHGSKPRPLTDRSTLTEVDLESVRGNAYDAVRRLRAFWLNGRSPRHDPMVYMNGVRYSSLAGLLQLEVESIHSMEYIPPMEAVMRWGSHVGGGVINIVTK